MVFLWFSTQKNTKQRRYDRFQKAKGVSQHKPPKSSAAIAYGWMKRFTGEMVILKWPCLVDSILMVLTVNNG